MCLAQGHKAVHKTQGTEPLRSLKYGMREYKVLKKIVRGTKAQIISRGFYFREISDLQSFMN